MQVKKETLENDDFDDLVAANTGKSLAARLGNSPDMILKKAKAKKGDGLKQTKLSFKKVSNFLHVSKSALLLAYQFKEIFPGKVQEICLFKVVIRCYKVFPYV